jgi:putative membrane protein
MAGAMTYLALAIGHHLLVFSLLGVLVFGIVALLSIVPTIRILAWRRALKSDHAFSPPPDEIGRVRRFLAFELMVFPLIPIFAAAMAMGYGLG